MSECKLIEANGIATRECDEEACVFWRALGHLDAQDGTGCAIQHYELLGDDGVAEWLLSVKTRYERVVAGS